MSSYIFSILTDGSLVMGYYRSKTPNGKCVIVAIGAPNLMDVDSLRNAEILTHAGYDVLVPEYYGFCRSSGEFTPMNSIQTLIDAYALALGKTKNLTEVYTGTRISISYNDITFLGMSYGGFAVLMLPKFLPEAKKIAAFYPVTEYSSFGKRGVKEETVEDFLSSIYRGFVPLYRGIDKSEWALQFRDILGLTPILNIECMQDVDLFLAHGTADESIYYKKTQEYFELLLARFPSQNIVYKEYQSAGHGLATMIPATYELVGWLGIEIAI